MKRKGQKSVVDGKLFGLEAKCAAVPALIRVRNHAIFGLHFNSCVLPVIINLSKLFSERLLK